MNGVLFSDVDIGARIPARRPLRAMWRLIDASLHDALRFGGRNGTSWNGLDQRRPRRP